MSCTPIGHQAVFWDIWLVLAHKKARVDSYCLARARDIWLFGTSTRTSAVQYLDCWVLPFCKRFEDALG